MKRLLLLLTLLAFGSFNSIAQTVRIPALFAGSASVVLPVKRGDIIGAWGRTAEYFVLYDDLKATALVISDGAIENGLKKKIAIVSVDLLLVYNGGVEGQPDYIEQIKREVNTRLKEKAESMEVIVVATHVHAAPDMKGLHVQPIADAIIRANDNLQQAKMAVGVTTAGGMFNRIERQDEKPRTQLTVHDRCRQNYAEYLKLHPRDPINNQIGIISFVNLKGNNIALVVNLATHPVIFGGEANHVVSSDFPGYVEREIARDLGGEVLYLQGAAGDINPWCSLATGDEAESQVQRFGTEITKAVIRAVSKFTDYNTKIAVSFRSDSVLNEQPAYPGFQYHLKSAEIHAILFGSSTALITTPGELFSKLGKDIQNGSAIKNTFVLGYTNDAIGYIPERDYCGPEPIATAYSTHPEDKVMFIPCGFGEKIVSKAITLLK
jgi:neutral ceramidase